MRYQVVVGDVYQNGFLQTSIKGQSSISALQIKIDCLRNKRCRFIPIAEDFFLIAAVVYSLDKMVPRGQTNDNWTREIQVAIPVLEQARWSGVAAGLAHCIGFLTGDRWSFSFESRGSRLFTEQKPKRNRPVADIAGDAVCLFSGGLDSLVGTIDWLESHPAKHLLLVGHHDGKVPGTHKDQRDVLEKIAPHYAARLDSVFIGVGQNPPGSETTFRSRSLLFISMGMLFASSLGEKHPVLIPENGAIALNAPLSPSRRGTCSTRTAHPYFITSLREILNSIGIKNPILNPHEAKSKGEVLQLCKNQPLLQLAISSSVSCAKRNRRGNPEHEGSWKNRGARNCGRCMPCIYRRASLHTIGEDHEVYGLDICREEVDIDGSSLSANDLKTFLFFLKIQTSKTLLERVLFGTSKMEYQQLLIYTDIIWRALDEVRKLLTDKATPKIRRAAGLP